jgi:hypothetical protein
MAVSAYASSSDSAQVPVPGKLERLYQDGDRRALIIYHPTYRDEFLLRITERFAEGLAESGWQVRRITADPGAVAKLDLDSYDTIVFGTNVIGGAIDQPTQQVLDTLPPLQQRFCAGLISGAADTEAPEAQLRARLAEKGCFEPLVWTFWTERRHMDPFLNLADPRPHREIALQVAWSRAIRSAIWWTRYRVRD